MKQHLIASAMLATILTACPAQPQTPDTSAEPTKNTIGLLEVKITGIGEGSTPDASASFVQAKPNTRAVTAATDAGIVLQRRAVAFTDNNDSGTTTDVNTSTASRFIVVSFDIINNKAQAFNNLTFHAVNVTGLTLGGTAFTSIQRGDGTALSGAVPADVALVQKIIPEQGVRLDQLGVVPNSSVADLQWMPSAESTAIETQAAAFVPPVIVQALDYGFVVRNRLGGRAIAASNTPGNCTVDACKGSVTLTYKLPKITPRVANPFTFAMDFVVSNNDQQFASQSLLEQSQNLSSNATLGINGYRVLNGSNAQRIPNLVPLCQARIARPTVSSSIFAGSLSVAGQPDCTFGASGKRVEDIGALSKDDAADVAIAPGGKVVLVGSTNTNNGDFVVWRLNPDGSNDTSFNTDGAVSVDIGSSSVDEAVAVAVQTNGKIVVAGTSGSDFALIRLNTNGSLDTTFNTTGKIVKDGLGVDKAGDVTLDSSDNILLAGTSSNQFSLLKLNSSGVLQNINTGLGIVGNTSICTSIVTSGTGQIYLGGYTKIVGAADTTNNFLVMRVNLVSTTSFALDTTFNTIGIQNVDVFADDRIQDMAVYPSTDLTNPNKLVVTGQDDAVNPQFALARFNANGTLDTSLNLTGIISYFINSPLAPVDLARSINIDQNSKIIIVGDTPGAIPNTRDFAVLRLNSDGTEDTSFHGTGRFTIDMDSSNDLASGLVFSNNNLILAGTRVGGATADDFQVVQIKP